MYPYPTNNYHVPQFPTYTPMASNIPELQYVNSAESADAFNLPPNKTAVLFNQNNDEFYIIQSDASGSRTRTDFTFKVKAKDSSSEYITRGEFEAFKTSITGTPTATKKTAKKATQSVTEGEEE